MQVSSKSRTTIATPLIVATVLLSCSDQAPPAPTLETLALSLDSIAIQFRDSASELTASPRGALGVELDAAVTWRSKNEQIVAIVPNGKTVRLIPVRPGAAEVEASAEHLASSAKVVVLDTAFNVTITALDTMVTMGRSLLFTATANVPPGASSRIIWSIGNPAVARIDSSQGANPVRVVSLDTGSTDVTATSAIDRKKFTRARFRTAPAAELYFESQPGQVTSPIRANDLLIPGPVVKVRDALGNPFPGTLDITMTVAQETAPPGARLFGTPMVAYASGEARYGNIGIDSAGSGIRLRASAPGLPNATSEAFTVGPECPGIPYQLGTTVSGTLTEDSCKSAETVYYARYVVTSQSAQYIAGITTPPMRWGVVFRDGTRPGPQTDTIPHLISPGTYSIRVYSTTTGILGGYQLNARLTTFATRSQCNRTQAHVGTEAQDQLRCVNTGGTCGGTDSLSTEYRLHIHPNTPVTITASSTTFDPCLQVSIGSETMLDDNSGGGTTARLVIPASPNGRNILVNVSSRVRPLPPSPVFTIRIQP